MHAESIIICPIQGWRPITAGGTSARLKKQPMNTKNNEANGQPLDEETKAILDELREEGETIEGDTPEVKTETEEAPSQDDLESAPEEQKEPEAPKEEQKEPEATEERVIDRSQKEPALIPAWEHKVAEKRWQKEKENLETELERYRANPTKNNADRLEAATINIAEIAEQSGIALDENQQRFFEAVLQNVQSVPNDVSEKLKALENDRQIAHLEQEFEREFNSETLPVIKQQFGEVPDSTLAEVKKSLHKLAFSDAYAKVPLKKVFLAEQETFKLQRTEPKTSIEAPNAKAGAGREVSKDYSNVTEADIDKMSMEEFEKYEAWQKENEKSAWR